MKRFSVATRKPPVPARSELTSIRPTVPARLPSCEVMVAWYWMTVSRKGSQAGRPSRPDVRIWATWSCTQGVIIWVTVMAWSATRPSRMAAGMTNASMAPTTTSPAASPRFWFSRALSQSCGPARNSATTPARNRAAR